ncbi:SNF2 family N-terminal domain-containing protein [Dichotomopilus funicola]|uniref:SNF2 family N-terminal domain-containing protein n=1 Tax=Dichotomopilus funicola TaxID=1934379 RepID=A0AAN6ZR73_9PEZI|nr:SNF2 family N-terminal domain-containing protein [Dichotomopilus funicola]
MAEDDQDDPFLWDEDRVVQELCTVNRSWKAPAAKRLPDPATLEAKIRDCGVDGESLLTYGDELGYDQLWGSLGVKKLPHQLALKDAINQFRKRSEGFKKWRALQLANSQTAEIDEAAIKSESLRLDDPQAAIEPTPALDVGPGQTHARPVGAAEDLGNTYPGVLSPTLSGSVDCNPLDPAQVLEGADAGEGEPPKKKRRAALTTVLDDTLGDRNFTAIPVEGDIFNDQFGDQVILNNTAEALIHASGSTGFLGPRVLLQGDILAPALGIPSDPANDAFTLLPSHIAPGRRLQVAAVMKRFLRTNLAEKLQLDDGNGSVKADSEDIESDHESVDSETWREYQEEEEELAAIEAGKAANNDRGASKEEATELIKSIIKDLEARWLAEKKPKCDLKAFKTWQDARRNTQRAALISRARNDLAHFDKHLAKLSGYIIGGHWTTKELTEKAAGFLEATVDNKMRQKWLIDPSTLPRPAPKRVKRPEPMADDEEVLTSDDDIGAFVEYDEEDQFVPPIGDEMDVDSEPLYDQTVTKAPDAPSSVPDVARSPSRTTDLLSVSPTPRKIKTETAVTPATLRQTGAAASEAIVIDSSPSPPKLTDDEKIGEIGIQHWEQAKDPKRLLVAVLCEWSRGKLSRIYEAINGRSHTELWAKHMQPILTASDDLILSAADPEETFHLCRLFDIFISVSAQRFRQTVLKRSTRHRMKREGGSFAKFCSFLRRILSYFLGIAPQPPTPARPRGGPKGSRQGMPASPTPSTPLTVKRHDPADDPETLEEESASDEPNAPDTPLTKKRRRKKRRDATAKNLRLDNVKRNEEFNRRTRELRDRLAKQGSVSSKTARLIVNETKESDDQALIYFNDHIGSKIKDHQIEGVRFMWNQVVVDSNIRQGCLLAHTMGLGKTMQVISLLVVIAESSASPDESVWSQIPESLRDSKTLILCPASLVDNWEEEIRMWAPNEVLGPVWRVDTALPSKQVKTLEDWASSGGILLLSYNRFTTLMRTDEAVAKLLQETPNLVVGDEAHSIKNSESMRHQATANFTTMSRIAMTGSPLTNNVMDYYAMINWVAPNYLADIAEFRDRFSRPINDGLFTDSEEYKKRKARRMLHVLKETVDPKVHRRDIEVLQGELPKKREFIITLPLTKVQTRLYRIYIECALATAGDQATTQAKAWSLVANLGLVLAHPVIFKTVTAHKEKVAATKAQAAQPQGKNEEETEVEVEVPQNVMSQMRTAVAIREIENYSLSNKVLALLQILEECKKVGDKVLVFSQRTPTLDYIENIFKRKRVIYQRLDGHTPVATRQDSVKKFNTASESEVYLVATRAGGVGLNIYGANRVVIFDFKYSPTDEKQAIGRAYRLGQTKPVYVYWLTIGGTFEDTIHNRAVFKTQLASRVVDKKNPDPYSRKTSEYFKMPEEVEQQDLSGAKGQDRVLDALLDSEEIGSLIRKITSTETFEREETYELTQEEKQEAEKDIQMERLRSQNPEEYRRREQERAMQARGISGMYPLPPGLFPPRPGFTDGESQPVSDGTASRCSRIVKIKVPEHLRERLNLGPRVVGNSNSDHSTRQLLTPTSTALARQPVPPAVAAVNAALAATTFAATTHAADTPPSTIINPPLAVARPLADQGGSAGPQTAPVPNGAASDSVPAQQEAAPVPQPILASGSQFKGAQNISPSAAPSGPSWSAPGPSFSETVISASDFPELVAVHNTLSQEGRHVRHHPTELISRIASIWAQNKVGRLPMVDKTQNLQKFSRSQRFSEAMLSGYMDPEQLATMKRPEMEAVWSALGAMSAAEFKQQAWTAKADINNVRNTDNTRNT